jgi:hypothetical protein
VKHIVALLVAVAGGLTVCSTALANSLTSGHSSPGQVPGQFTPPSAGTHLGGTQPNGSGTLPFTGFNLATVAAVALLLVVSGIVLHRLTQRRQ